MKSFVLTIMALFMSASLFAQFSGGHRTIGASLHHCSIENEDENRIQPSGVGIKYQYYFNRKWVFEPSASFFFSQKENGIEIDPSFELNANVQYRFTISDKFQVYPLAGLGFTSFKIKVQHFGKEPYETTSSPTEFLFNLGGGVAYQLSPELQVNAEAKYQSMEEWDREVYSLGINYQF